MALGAAAGSPYQDPAARIRFYDRLLDSALSIPGLAAFGLTSSFPFTFSPNALLEEDGVPHAAAAVGSVLSRPARAHITLLPSSPDWAPED